MSRSTTPPKNQDDQLADFTDRVLAGKAATLASPSDPELRELEETVLRLNQAFPEGSLDEKVSRRMQADFKSRMRKANASHSGWQSQRSRQRIGLALAGIAILVSILLLSPFLVTGSGNVQGTAGTQSQSIIGLAIGFAGVLALAIWLVRRK